MVDRIILFPPPCIKRYMLLAGLYIGQHPWGWPQKSNTILLYEFAFLYHAINTKQWIAFSVCWIDFKWPLYLSESFGRKCDRRVLNSIWRTIKNMCDIYGLGFISTEFITKAYAENGLHVLKPLYDSYMYPADAKNICFIYVSRRCRVQNCQAVTWFSGDSPS